MVYARTPRGKKERVFLLDSMSLLFQTGYLSVKEIIYTPGAPIYVLEIPDREVGEAFNKNIIAAFTESGRD